MQHIRFGILSSSKLNLRGAACGLLLSVLTLCVGAVPAQAVDLVLLDDKDQPITQLVIGTDLRFAVTGAVPYAKYRVEVRNDYNLSIAAAETRADANGVSNPRTAWEKTGVVGCTPCAEPNLRFNVYETFEDARVDLDGRKLVVNLIDPGTQTVLDTKSLNLVVNPTRLLIYPADGSGCPNFDRLRGDNIHLILSGLPTAVTEVRIFVIEKTGPSTSILKDLRGPGFENGQVITISPSSSSSSSSPSSSSTVLPTYNELIWAAPDDTCETELVIRFSYGGVPSSGNPTLEPGDTVLDGPVLTTSSQGTHSGGGRNPEDNDECEVCDTCQVC